MDVTVNSDSFIEELLSEGEEVLMSEDDEDVEFVIWPLTQTLFPTQF